MGTHGGCGVHIVDHYRRSSTASTRPAPLYDARRVQHHRPHHDAPWAHRSPLGRQGGEHQAATMAYAYMRRSGIDDGWYPTKDK